MLCGVGHAAGIQPGIKAWSAHTEQVWQCWGNPVRMGVFPSLHTQNRNASVGKPRVGERLLTPPALEWLRSHSSARGPAALAQVWVRSLFITRANRGEQERLIGVQMCHRLHSLVSSAWCWDLPLSARDKGSVLATKLLPNPPPTTLSPHPSLRTPGRAQWLAQLPLPRDLPPAGLGGCTQGKYRQESGK